MTHSGWICNNCGEEFGTKGKRDSHRERTHRQKTSIGIGKRRAERSENGKFSCKCGRDYVRAHALRRHQKTCKDEILSEEIADDENVEKGTHETCINGIIDCRS